MSRHCEGAPHTSVVEATLVDAIRASQLSSNAAARAKLALASEWIATTSDEVSAEREHYCRLLDAWTRETLKNVEARGPRALDFKHEGRSRDVVSWEEVRHVAA